MTYNERRPTFEMIEWAGDAEAVLTFVNEHAAPQDYSTRANEDGSLFVVVAGSYLGAAVPEGDVLVVGPIFGTDRSQAALRAMTVDEFAAQFVAA